MTKRANGNYRIGAWSMRNTDGQLKGPGDEVIEEKEFDIPEAYQNTCGICWRSSHWPNLSILSHPTVLAWMESTDERYMEREEVKEEALKPI